MVFLWSCEDSSFWLLDALNLGWPTKSGLLAANNCSHHERDFPLFLILLCAGQSLIQPNHGGLTLILCHRGGAVGAHGVSDPAGGKGLARLAPLPCFGPSESDV
jgi:hypothetical protein